jgi:hypothetical protein
MSILREEPFLLPQGEYVVARVAAINIIGPSDFSEDSSQNETQAVVMDVPLKPT